MAVERMRSADNIGELAKELGITRRTLYKWQTKLDYLELGEEGPRPNSHESAFRKQVHQLKRLLAEKTLEVDFFKKSLAKSQWCAVSVPYASVRYELKCFVSIPGQNGSVRARLSVSY